jgi:hypothetical protein
MVTQTARADLHEELRVPGGRLRVRGGAV